LVTTVGACPAEVPVFAPCADALIIPASSKKENNPRVRFKIFPIPLNSPFSRPRFASS
jgi:hypothetical protein